MSHLSLAFLGGFDVTLDGQPLTKFGTSKSRALLCYLAMEAETPIQRSQIAMLLWPELDDRKAAHNLSQTLLRLRRALGDNDFLLTTQQTIQLNPHADYQLDATRFRQLIAARRRHHASMAAGCTVCSAWLQQAADLYRGDFLANFFLKDSVEFEEWRLLLQEQLHNQMVWALGELVDFHMARGAYQQVRIFARRLLLLEPWQEPAQRQLMEALVRLGRSAAAVEQYEAYTHRLRQELGLRPSAELQTLFKRIQAGELTPSQHDVQPRSDEKRQVTALVCSRRHPDGEHDPEEMVRQRQLCSQQCDPLVARFGGQRTARTGGHCLIYFGFPATYEDNARRAVQAGLSMAATHCEQSQVRVGIDTGMLVVQKNGELLGAVPEGARTCHQSAEAGTVIISQTTEQLLHDSLAREKVGRFYHVKRLLPPRDRIARRMTPLIGRAETLTTLQCAVTQLRDEGAGMAIVMQGTAGVGKSRLVWEIVNAAPLRWIECACSPLTQNTQLAPLVQLLAQLLGLPAENAQRQQLHDALTRMGLMSETAAWQLGVLLGIDPQPPTITPDQLEQMRLLFVALLQKQTEPFGVVIEDLHWADPSTLRWIDRSLPAMTAAPCLLVMTQRPNATVVWSPQLPLTHVEVLPLNSSETEQMTRAITDDTLPDSVRQQIIAQTDGVPLFIEEVANSVATNDAIPLTLRDSLTARLGQLGQARETAQWAATIGREFSVALLQAVTQFDAQRLRDDVAQMVAVDLVHPQHNQYRFKHVLMQQAAYSTILKRDYQQRQRCIAETLIASFANIVATQPERVAHHFAEAGMGLQSADYLIRAGERATRQGALEEASRSFEQALAGIGSADDRRRWLALFGRSRLHDLRGDRTAQQADLTVLLTIADQLDDDTLRAKAALRQVRFASRNDDFDGMAQAAQRAVTLARQAELDDLVLRALTLQMQALTSSGSWEAAREAAEAARVEAQRSADPTTRALALGDIAYYYLESGDLAQAVALFTAGIEGARLAKDRRKEYLFGNNLGFAYAQLGLFDSARDILQTSQAVAQSLGDRRMVAHHDLNLGFVAWRTGERTAARQQFTHALATFEQINDTFGQASCWLYRGMMGCEDQAWAEAVHWLDAAGKLFAKLDAGALLAQTRSADAVCRLALEDATTAGQLATATWHYIQQHGTGGIDLVGVVYNNLADVCTSLPILPMTAADVLAAASHDILQRAAKIDNPQWRTAFLENEVGNRRIMARYHSERIHMVRRDA